MSFVIPQGTNNSFNCLLLCVLFVVPNNAGFPAETVDEVNWREAPAPLKGLILSLNSTAIDVSINIQLPFYYWHLVVGNYRIVYLFKSFACEKGNIGDHH